LPIEERRAGDGEIGVDRSSRSANGALRFVNRRPLFVGRLWREARRP
jgi:hypothetical protein